MKNLVLGALLMAGVAAAASGTFPGRDQLWAGQVSPADGSSSELIALAAPAGDNRQMLTVVDPRTRAISVYHVDVSTGAVTLKSVRNIHFDLQMMDYNGVSPLPGELRSMLGQR